MTNASDNPLPAAAPAETTSRLPRLPITRMRTGVMMTFIGLLIFILGTKPAWFKLDRSPTVGFIQISVFLVGLGIMCLGGYTGLLALWKGQNRSIPADIGLRLISTGYVIAVFAGMADLFGFGSQPPPQVPYFGPLQATGVLIGLIVIAIGFLMLIPYKKI